MLWKCFNSLKERKCVWIDVELVEFSWALVFRLLKCERTDTKTCTLVFYAKSKIKNIIYLTIDLQLTNSEHIIREMHMEINKLQVLFFVM